MNGTKIKLDISDKIIRTLGYILVTIYAIACVFPFLIILGTSFTSEAIVRVEGVQLIPKEFTTYAYELILKAGTIGRILYRNNFNDGMRYGRWLKHHA